MNILIHDNTISIGAAVEAKRFCRFSIFGFIRSSFLLIVLILSLIFSFLFPLWIIETSVPEVSDPILLPAVTDTKNVPDIRLPTNTIKVLATAYSSTKDQTDSTPFITANGKTVYDGLIAANFLPMGTKLRIPELFGDKVMTVNDRMHPRYGHGRIDVWMPSREQATDFGIKRVHVEIYED